MHLHSGYNRELIVGKSGQMRDPKDDAGLRTDVGIVANTGGVKQVIVTECPGMSAVILLRRKPAVVAHRIELGEQTERVEP